MVTHKLMQIIVVGGSEWVMVLLLFLSVISGGIIIERALFFRRRRQQIDRLDHKLSPLLEAHDLAPMIKVLDQEDCPTLKTALAGYGTAELDREAIEKKVASALGRDRLRLEQRLGFLGTLGNNAPFIGLFGTVLGIIRAFRDLSLSGRPNTSVVMAGISEALVATAIGLFVALPAVLFYNYFQRHMDHTLAITESLAQDLMAAVPTSNGARPAPAKAAAGAARPRAEES